ncbi:cytosine permease [Desmospora profundinema]|uniref:Cytosine permease n=1 Tax=Desmospora profundinema TaxID=1571184 RepID=A0ABU1IHU9_9BACL|nr:cytosine permease [Desmospora profundinema]MDR6224122.1 cytosine permease [Desmospora profundinema]
MKHQSNYALANDYSREPVPLSERKSWLPLALVWIAMGVDLSAVVLSAALISGLTLQNTLIVVSVGSFILALIGLACSYVGSKTGLSTAMINRFTFGEKGSYLVIIVISVAYFGWFGVTAGFFGESAQYTIYSVTGLDISSKVLALIGGLLMTLTATIGFKAIEKLSLLAVPLMLGMLFSMLFKLFTDKENTRNLLHTHPVGDLIGFGTAISLVVGAFIVACSHSPDVARWAKSSKHAMLSGFFGFLIGNSLMMFIAAFLSKLTGTEDVIQIMLSIGWGALAVTILILSQWTTNDNHMYTLGLNLSVLFKWVPKPILTIIAGLLGTSFAVMGVYENFIDFLLLLSPFAAPIAGIYLTEYFFLNSDRLNMAFLAHRKIKPFYWHALFVWGIATTVAFATTPTFDGGWGLFTLSTIPSVDGLLSAAILHYVVGKWIVPRFESASMNETA